MPHTTVLQTCVTDDEKKALTAQAREHKMSVSAYIRKLIKAGITAVK